MRIPSKGKKGYIRSPEKPESCEKGFVLSIKTHSEVVLTLDFLQFTVLRHNNF